MISLVKGRSTDLKARPTASRKKGECFMMRKYVAILVCAVFLSAAVTVFADDVFATANGKKYHAEGCPLVKNKNPQPITKVDALEKGLTPCQKCMKDDVSSLKDDGKTKVASRKKAKKEVD